MPKLISYGNEMIRISNDGKKIEYSTNKGSSWIPRSTLTSSNGKALDLLVYGDEILLLTDKKIMYSKNKGVSWIQRASLENSNGEPQSLSDGGDELLLTTSKKLMYSKNKGASWITRKTF